MNSRQQVFKWVSVSLCSIAIGILLGGLWLWYQSIPLPLIAAQPTAVPAVEGLDDLLDEPHVLRIPALGIEAPIEAVGLDGEGRMEVPQRPQDVAWYALGVKPGEVGSAVIAGHFDWTDGPAIFYDLHTLTAGDVVSVRDADDKEIQFRVTRKASYPYDQFPLDEVFSKADGVHLNLITCAGSFDEATKNYSERVVVYTELVE